MRPLVFLALCVLSTSLFAGVAHASPDEIARYSASEYTYCDAKVLAGYWGQSVWDAKARIGRKIGWGDQDVLSQMRRDAGSQAFSDPAKQCQFYETEFVYADAQALAQAWGKTISQAKASLAKKASVVGEAEVRRSVLAEVGRPGSNDTRGVQASNLDPCHTKMLRHLWGEGAATVNATVQRKIANGNGAYIQAEIEQARKLARASERVACSFFETPYTYADAELLAARWRTDVSQAKAHIELKYKNGLEDWLASELAAVRGR